MQGPSTAGLAPRTRAARTPPGSHRGGTCLGCAERAVCVLGAALTRRRRLQPGPYIGGAWAVPLAGRGWRAAAPLTSLPGHGAHPGPRQALRPAPGLLWASPGPRLRPIPGPSAESGWRARLAPRRGHGDRPRHVGAALAGLDLSPALGAPRRGLRAPGTRCPHRGSRGPAGRCARHRPQGAGGPVGAGAGQPWDLADSSPRVWAGKLRPGWAAMQTPGRGGGRGRPARRGPGRTRPDGGYFWSAPPASSAKAQPRGAGGARAGGGGGVATCPVNYNLAARVSRGLASLQGQRRPREDAPPPGDGQ